MDQLVETTGSGDYVKAVTARFEAQSTNPITCMTAVLRKQRSRSYDSVRRSKSEGQDIERKQIGNVEKSVQQDRACSRQLVVGKYNAERSLMAETRKEGRCAGQSRSVASTDVNARNEEKVRASVCGVQARTQWPDGIKMETNRDYSITKVPVTLWEKSENEQLEEQERADKLLMENALHYADVALIDRELEMNEKHRSKSTSVRPGEVHAVKCKVAVVRSKSEGDGKGRSAGAVVVQTGKPKLAKKPKPPLPTKPQHKSSFSQSTTNCKQPDGLITTATGGILRSRSPDTAAPPKPHRKKSLIETIKQWNVISVRGKGVANCVHRQSGASDYVLHQVSSNGGEASSGKQTMLLKQNNKSGLWEQWLVKYADECLQFYDAKCPVTTPNAQVMLRVMESVYDIDDQKTASETLRHCFLIETSQHSYRFSACSSVEQRSWVGLLRSEIMHFKMRSALLRDSLQLNSNGSMPLGQAPGVTDLVICEHQTSSSYANEADEKHLSKSQPCEFSSLLARQRSVSLSKVVHEGCLWKQENKTQLWKYWKFVLTTDCLLCFKSYKTVRNGDQPLATIPVSLITGVTPMDANKNFTNDGTHQYPFEIVTGHGRNYVLAASTADDRDLWIVALNRILLSH